MDDAYFKVSVEQPIDINFCIRQAFERFLGGEKAAPCEFELFSCEEEVMADGDNLVYWGDK
jgi:hypothetical protein